MADIRTTRPTIRLRLALVMVLLAAPAALAQPPEPGADRFDQFIGVGIVSQTPTALAIGAGIIDQWSSFPEEWNGADGFWKRTLARRGAALASDGIGHAAAALLHHRVVYDPCACRGFARAGHAMKRAFVSRRDDGGSAPNYSLWIGKYSSAGLANAWYPPSYQADDIVREGALGIVIAGGLNVLREFTPELMRLNPFR
jgi:hypothetical protein